MENSKSDEKNYEEIRIQRRARRKEKQIAKQNQQKILQNDGSGKLKLINSETMKTYQMNKNKNHNPFNRRKFMKSIHLTDFIVDRKFKANTHVKTKLKPMKSSNFSINRWRGKRREFNVKKKHSKLKKYIIATRSARRKKREEVADVDASTTTIEDLINDLEDLKILNFKDESEKLQPKTDSHKRYIYSRKFRTYCDNLTTPNLCNLTENLLRDLFRFQKRAYDSNENKARAHKRYIVGFKEVKSYLSIDKLKLIIIAPDCEMCDKLDELINEIKSECQSRQILYIFSLRRHQLRRVLQKNTPISCVGILNYDGAQDTFSELKKGLIEERLNFKWFFPLSQSVPIT